MAVSKRTRFEVLRRDAHTCRYCKSTTSPLTVDHVTPVALGGSDAPDNLVACCVDCNAGKTSTVPDAETVAQVEDDAMRWAAAMQRAARERADEYDSARWWLTEFRAHWDEATTNAALPADWETTIRNFRASGVSLEEMEDAANLSAVRLSPWSRNHFRYFCGICWNIVRELNARAEEIVRSEEGTDGA